MIPSPSFRIAAAGLLLALAGCQRSPGPASPGAAPPRSRHRGAPSRPGRSLSGLRPRRRHRRPTRRFPWPT